MFEFSDDAAISADAPKPPPKCEPNGGSMDSIALSAMTLP